MYTDNLIYQLINFYNTNGVCENLKEAVLEIMLKV